MSDVHRGAQSAHADGACWRLRGRRNLGQPPAPKTVKAKAEDERADGQVADRPGCAQPMLLPAANVQRWRGPWLCAA